MHYVRKRLSYMKDIYITLYNNITKYLESVMHNASHNIYEHSIIQGNLLYLFNTSLPNYNHIDIIGDKINLISKYVVENDENIFEIKYSHQTLEYKKLVTVVTAYMMCVNDFISYYIGIVDIRSSKDSLLHNKFAIITCQNFCGDSIVNNDAIDETHRTILTCWELLNTMDIREDIKTIVSDLNNKICSNNLEYRLTPITNDLLSLT